MIDKKEASVLNEVAIKDSTQADTDLYHFFPDIADLLSSLMDSSIWSNKNERAAQFDIQAAYNTTTGELRDDAYVCFTTYPGKQGVYKGYQRPFGLSFANNTFDTDNTHTKIFSQIAFKSCKNVKNAKLMQKIQSEYKTKYGEAYGTSFIKDIANQEFNIHAIGTMPVLAHEKAQYLHSADPNHKYFISGGDSTKPWTVRYLPITAETKKVYNIIKNKFISLAKDPNYGYQIYWFDDKNYIGGPDEAFKLNPKTKVYKNNTKKDENRIDTSNMQFDSTYTYISKTTSVDHNIKPKYNLNPNYCPRPDQTLYYAEKDVNPIIRFSATISFPSNFRAFNEIIGIGRIEWDDPDLPDFNFVNPSSRGGYSNLVLKGLSISSLLPFLANMEANAYDINKVSLSQKDFENLDTGPLAAKKLAVEELAFKTLVSTFNEHEKRVYIKNKKNLYFNRNTVKSIILPVTCRIASIELNLANLISYIQQYKKHSTLINLQALLTKLPKEIKDSLTIPTVLSAPSELSDKALAALVHFKEGITKCLKQQIIEAQESDEMVPDALKKATKTSFVLPHYHLSLLRDLCKILEDPAAYGNVEIEFIGAGYQKRNVDKLTTAYKKVIDEIVTANEDTLVNSDSQTDQFNGVPKQFFMPEINKNGAPNYARYLINAKNFFDFDKAHTDENDRVYPDEISVLAPIKPQIVGDEVEATTGQAARVGAEILLLGFDRQGKGYLLMVPKPHLSINFFELPGGGLAQKASLTNEASRILELQKKLEHKTGIPRANIKYLVKSYPYQLLFSETSTSDNTDVLSKISWSFYFLSGGIYTKFLNPDDLEFRHQNQDYNAYLSWFPLDSIEYKNVFNARYSKLLPYIKALVNEGKKYISNGTISGDTDLNESFRGNLNEKLLMTFFENFWK